jgi:hypothetical protein
MRLQVRSVGITALLSAAVFAGAPGASVAQQQSTRTALDVITVTGCVEKETAYRTSIADGKGGTLGSGAGAANEYVLRSVQIVSRETLKPTGTTSREYEDVYSVTGKLEHELDRAVNHQIAMSGYIEVLKSNGTEKVKDLPNLNAVGWHVVSDHCTVAAPKR